MNDAIQMSIRRRLRRWVDNPADIDELSQEVLLKLHVAGPDDDEAVVPWVMRVTRNTAIDHLRTRRETTELPPLPVEGEGGETGGTDTVASWLPAMVEALEEPYRTAVRRVDLDGISQQQLAAELGISSSGARTRVQRGRVKLRETLLACCPVQFEGGEVVDTGANRCGGCA